MVVSITITKKNSNLTTAAVATSDIGKSRIEPYKTDTRGRRRRRRRRGEGMLVKKGEAAWYFQMAPAGAHQTPV